MVGKEEVVNSKFSDISIQLERRMDLIPNLVNSVKGYMSDEQSVIDSVTDARAELAGTENRIAVVRRDYNAAGEDFN